MALLPPSVRHPLDQIGAAFSEDDLIRIDYRTILLLTVVLVSFGAAVAFTLHGSSLPIWNAVLPDRNEPGVGLVAGTPRAIRFDEWAVLTPAMLSQAPRGFPDRNEAVGGGNTPLLMDLPVRSLPAVIRPQFWGFFLFDTAHGFSFYWNFRVFGLVLSAFFLFMLLTRNDFWLSVVGALWLYYSSFVQWWFSQAGTSLILSFCVLAVSAILLCFSTTTALICLSACLIVPFSVTFALSIYPPFQIPMAYLLFFLLAGYAWGHPKDRRIRTLAPLRAAALAATIFGTVALLWMFYAQARDTITLVSHTEYPGGRRSSGGELGLERLFSEFFGLFFFREGTAPQQWENVCEASNFLLLFPLVLPEVFTNFLRRTKNDPVVLLLLVYIALLTTWMLVPVPAWVGTVSLLDRVPAKRALIGVGIANIILIVRFLSHPSDTTVSGAPRLDGKTVAAAAAIFLMLWAYGRMLSRHLGIAMSTLQIVGVSSLFAFLSSCVLKHQRRLFGMAILPAVIAANYDVNPISIGLGPILGKQALPVVTAAAQAAPGARWVAYGNNIVGNFLQAAGVNVFNGTKFAPELSTMRHLDPAVRDVAIYNRYANVQVLPQENAGGSQGPAVGVGSAGPLPDGSLPASKSATLLDVGFELHHPDFYTIRASPCAQPLQDIGIRYFAFSYLPTAAELRCLVPLSAQPTSGLWLYERSPSASLEASWPLTGARLSQDTAGAIVNLQLDRERAMLVVTGWAVDSAANDVAGGAAVEIDGKIFEARYGLDTAAMVDRPADPASRYAGFEVDVPLGRIGRGSHVISLSILTKDRRAYFAAQPGVSFDLQ